MGIKWLRELICGKDLFRIENGKLIIDKSITEIYFEAKSVKIDTSNKPPVNNGTMSMTSTSIVIGGSSNSTQSNKQLLTDGKKVSIPVESTQSKKKKYYYNKKKSNFNNTTPKQ